MEDKKKIILIGPPGVGKTTIKKVYFEKANPLYLLKNPLNPSRGMDSTVYHAFNSRIGIFDLAGQENEIWFHEKAKDIFNDTTLIICVFDISASLEFIINFILDVDRIKRELDSPMSNLIVLLHKIDKFNEKYVKNKLNSLKNFFTNQNPMGSRFKIYLTSITEEFFLNTFVIITNIIKRIFKDNIIPISNSEFLNLRTEILILLKFEALSKYHRNDLVSKLRLKSNKLIYHMERLEELAFLESFDNYHYFQLTERALYLKRGIEKYQNKIHIFQVKSCIELLHTLRNVHKIEV